MASKSHPRVAGGLAEVIELFRADPDMQRFDTADDVGGCWEASQRFAWYCHQSGIAFRWRKWHNLPGYRTAFQHNVEVDGQIIDWTYRQYHADAAWPHVESLEAYREHHGEPLPICVRCGSKPHPGQRCLGIFRDQVGLIRARLLADRLGGRFPR